MGSLHVTDSSKKRRAGGLSALIVEGGGMRGVFSAGVLDSFLKRTFDPFDLYFGVSAGANTLSSHVAGQLGRNLRIYRDLCTQPQFMNLRKYLFGGHYMDLDWLWDMSARHDPFDIDRALEHTARKDFFVVATSLTEGRPLYLRPDRHTWATYLKASSSVPLAYRGRITIDGHEVVDGGVSDALPVREAYRRGATRLVVVRTQPLDRQVNSRLEPLLMRLAFRRYPKMRRVLKRYDDAYQEALDFIAQPPPGVEVIQIAPPGPLKTRRDSRDVSGLEKDYQLGFEVGRAFLGTFRRVGAWLGARAV